MSLYLRAVPSDVIPENYLASKIAVVHERADKIIVLDENVVAGAKIIGYCPNRIGHSVRAIICDLEEIYVFSVRCL
jgi:hypothetical protein